MPPINKHYLITQTKEIRISGVDILDIAAYARRIFDGEAISTTDMFPNIQESPVIERELNIREES